MDPSIKLTAELEEIVCVEVVRVTCAVPYVAYEPGAGERPGRAVVGAPQVVLKLEGGFGVVHCEPPNPLVGSGEEPSHDARVTSVHAGEPAVLPVPTGHVEHALAPATEKVFKPQMEGALEASGQL